VQNEEDQEEKVETKTKKLNEILLAHL